MAEKEALTDFQIGQIEGRNSVSRATPEDVERLLAHVFALQHLLDEGDQEDAFGTEGWRHRIGIGG